MQKVIEEKVEDILKQKLNQLGIRFYAKTEEVNSEIENALKSAPSKNGGSGKNYPDLKLLINDIPVMIEVKGDTKDMRKLKITREGAELDMSENAISKNAVNGAVHYAQAVVNNSKYEKCIAIGVSAFPSYELLIWSYIVEKDKPLRLLREESNKNDLNFLKKLNL